MSKMDDLLLSRLKGLEDSSANLIKPCVPVDVGNVSEVKAAIANETCLRR
ncbi:hypothetical protein [Azospirillum baldaniorum]|nr:hypothetical protein [Azospirillum baldaniorum]